MLVAVRTYNADTDHWSWYKANETSIGPWLVFYLRGGHYKLLLSSTQKTEIQGSGSGY